MRRVAAILAVLSVVLFAPRASAHATGVSRGEYRATGDIVHVLLVFASAELATSFAGLDADHDGKLSQVELDADSHALDDDVVRRTIIQADASACTSRFESAKLGETDAVEIRATFTCEHAPRHLSIDCEFWESLAAGHRHIALVELGGHESTLLAAFSQKKLEADAGPSARPTTSFGAMVLTGIEHILTGYDHLAFLLGLILLGGRVRSLLGTITAFTIAHSISLALATLHVVSVGPRIVEPAIALSIAYVGIENLFVKDGSKRWRITFPFGLIHGFGFAGALQELDLPRAQLPGALFAFNCGVEIGQLGVLAVILPLVLIARKNAWVRDRGVKIASLGIALAGVAWFVARVLG